MSLITTVEPEGVNAMSGTDGWEEIEMAVDSGATETVVGPEGPSSVETKEAQLSSAV